MKINRNKIISENREFILKYYTLGFPTRTIVESIFEYNILAKKKQLNIDIKTQKEKEDLVNKFTNTLLRYHLNKKEIASASVFIDYLKVVLQEDDYTPLKILKTKSLESVFFNKCLGEQKRRRKAIALIIAPSIKEFIQEDSEPYNYKEIASYLIDKDKNLYNILKLFLNGTTTENIITTISRVLRKYFPYLQDILEEKKALEKAEREKAFVLKHKDTVIFPNNQTTSSSSKNKDDSYDYRDDSRDENEIMQRDIEQSEIMEQQEKEKEELEQEYFNSNESYNIETEEEMEEIEVPFSEEECLRLMKDATEEEMAMGEKLFHESIKKFGEDLENEIMELEKPQKKNNATQDQSSNISDISLVEPLKESYDDDNIEGVKSVEGAESVENKKEVQEEVQEEKKIFIPPAPNKKFLTKPFLEIENLKKINDLQYSIRQDFILTRGYSDISYNHESYSEYIDETSTEEYAQAMMNYDIEHYATVSDEEKEKIKEMYESQTVETCKLGRFIKTIVYRNINPQITNHIENQKDNAYVWAKYDFESEFGIRPEDGHIVAALKYATQWFDNVFYSETKQRFCPTLKRLLIEVANLDYFSRDVNDMDAYQIRDTIVKMLPKEFKTQARYAGAIFNIYNKRIHVYAMQHQHMLLKNAFDIPVLSNYEQMKKYNIEKELQPEVTEKESEILEKFISPFIRDVYKYAPRGIYIQEQKDPNFNDINFIYSNHGYPRKLMQVE